MFKNMSKRGRTYAFFIILCELTGVVSGLISMVGMRNFDDVMQSDLTPPAILFPIVWVVLYALMGTGTARMWLAAESLEQFKALVIFIIQLAVNFFWSIIFFDFRAFQLAFWWLLLLLILIILMTAIYMKIDRIAAWLQMPYILWVTFAGYLTYMAWMMN